MAIESYESLVESLQLNADWRVGPDPAKARAFVTAATKLVVMMPVASADDGASTSTNINQIAEQMKQAQAYLNSISTAANSRVRFFSFGGFRK